MEKSVFFVNAIILREINYWNLNCRTSETSIFTILMAKYFDFNEFVQFLRAEIILQQSLWLVEKNFVKSLYIHSKKQEDF